MTAATAAVRGRHRWQDCGRKDGTWTEVRVGYGCGHDRGYEDHAWWRKLTVGKRFFVSPLKDSTNYGIVEKRPQPADPILRDEVIMLASEPESDRPMLLRRVEVWLEDKQESMVFVSNHLRLAAWTVAAIYRDRWQIALFFKAIKQSLRIKAFIGTSASSIAICGVG